MVPPPVSAPEQLTNLNPRLAMPAPSVVAPPPTRLRGDETRAGLRPRRAPKPDRSTGRAGRGRCFRAGTSAGLGSDVGGAAPGPIGRRFAPRSVAGGMGRGPAVVPPPPSVSAGGSLTGRAREIAAPGWAARWTPAWRPRHPAATAAEAPPAWSSPANPDRKLACPAAVEAEPWPCLLRAATSPAWADRAVGAASAAAKARAADSPARARARARKAPAPDRIPWPAVEFLPIPAPAAQAPAPMALPPCPEFR